MVSVGGDRQGVCNDPRSAPCFRARATKSIAVGVAAAAVAGGAYGIVSAMSAGG